MTGEIFLATNDQVTASFNCPALLFPGIGQTITFTASGNAGGPYPGPFTEQGTFVLGNIYPGNPSYTLVQSFQASFTVDSPAGQIHGTKSLGAITPNEANAGYCVGDSQNNTGTSNVGIHARYQATIQSAAGTQSDQGDSNVSFLYLPAGSLTTILREFEETFASTAPPATVMLSPVAATNPVGSSHTVTATVTDASGQPVPGVTVHFTVTGAVNTSGSCLTDANGQCSFTYQGPVLPGQDVITGCAGPNGAAPCGTATKTWVLPVSTPGCEVNITNGGWIVAPDGGNGSFGGNAKIAADGTLSGEEQYTDHGATNIDVHSLYVLAIVCNNNFEFADIYGQATINGAGAHYFRIEVTDPDTVSGPDTYGITLDTGYTTGDQPLRGGNVEIHTTS